MSEASTTQQETTLGVPPEPPAPARDDGGSRIPGQTIATPGPLIALIITCAFFASQSSRFLTGTNLSLVVQQVSVLGVLAIGQTLIILTAGIDLSCGTVMAFGS